MKLATERLREVEVMLRQKWPDAFTRHRPLVQGCHKDLLTAFSDVRQQDLLRVLNAWTHHPDYLKAIMTKTFRITLEGQVAGEIREQDKVHAAHQLFQFMQRQRPWGTRITSRTGLR